MNNKKAWRRPVNEERGDVVEVKPLGDRQLGRVDPEKYAEHLKQQLEIYCKAVAMSWVGILFFFFVEFYFLFLLILVKNITTIDVVKKRTIRRNHLLFY
jgi:hypothetical protein